MAGPRLALTIAAGTLHDEDKGESDLAGLEIGVGVSDAEPCEVLNPDLLSELQQAGVADAVASHLQSLGIQCVPANLVLLDGAATLHGVLGTSTLSAARHAPAAFWAPHAACEAAGGIAALQTLAAARALTRVVTITGSHPLAFAVHGSSIDDVVCLIGRLERLRIH
jgi:hypothetical protein